MDNFERILDQTTTFYKDILDNFCTVSHIKDVIKFGRCRGLWPLLGQWEGIYQCTYLVKFLFYVYFRAWSKMLNFSDDQAPKGNKGALLWKFVMDHIVNNRKERRKSVSGLVNT